MVHVRPIRKHAPSRLRFAWLTALIVGLTVCLVEPAAACPSCKEAVAGENGEAGADTSRLGRGYSYSVLFMMAVPFALVAGFGGVCYWHLRKNPSPQV